ncbi:MAG: hypothetical protein ACP5NF_07340 [Thermoanaerobaculum sp.]
MSWQANESLEKEAVQALVAMPPGPAKNALAHLVLRVASALAHVRCAQAQGDGLPCDDVEPDCLTCRGWEQRLWEAANGLR